MKRSERAMTVVNGPARRRGVAMLLVLVAVAVGTVLAGVALSARNNSPAIGVNAAHAAKASWAAHAAEELAMGILESTVDWSVLEQGQIVSQRTLAGATVSAVVTRLDGQAPGPADRELILRVTATSGGMEHVVERRISTARITPIEMAVNPYLDEYALFVGRRIELDPGVVIKPYWLSPDAGTMMPIRIGLGIQLSTDYIKGGSALAKNIALFLNANASATLASELNDSDFQGGGAGHVSKRLALNVLGVCDTLPESLDGLDDVGGDLRYDSSYAGSNAVISTPGRYGRLEVGNGRIVTIDGSQADRLSFESILVRDGAVLRVEGNPQIHVRDGLEVRDLSAFEVDHSAVAVVYLAGNLRVSDAVLGVDRSYGFDGARCAEDIPAYINPARLRIVSLVQSDGGASAIDVRIRNGSIAAAAIHTPNAVATIEDGSALIGRLSTRELTIRSGAAVYYDQMLDPRTGFASPVGPVYGEDGQPHPEILSVLGSFNGELGATALGDELTSALVTALGSETVWGIVTDTARDLLSTTVDLLYTAPSLTDTLVGGGEDLGGEEITGESVVEGGGTDTSGGLLGGLLGGTTELVGGAIDDTSDLLFGSGSGTEAQQAAPPAPLPQRRSARVLSRPIAAATRLGEGN